MINMLKEYFEIREKIHNYFEYVEDWVTIPLNDCTNYYWEIVDGDEGEVRYSNKKHFPDDCTYNDSIYTQRFLPKWAYRAKDYTMICVDTQTDGNKYLSIFDNQKEIKEY